MSHRTTLEQRISEASAQFIADCYTGQSGWGWATETPKTFAETVEDLRTRSEYPLVRVAGHKRGEEIEACVAFDPPVIARAAEIAGVRPDFKGVSK